MKIDDGYRAGALLYVRVLALRLRLEKIQVERGLYSRILVKPYDRTTSLMRASLVGFAVIFRLEHYGFSRLLCGGVIKLSSGAYLSVLQGVPLLLSTTLENVRLRHECDMRRDWPSS